MAAATCTILIHVFSIWNALEAAAVLSVDTPGNYLKSLSLTCNDSTFTVGSAYFWYKAGSTFYSQAGELGSTGRYTHSEVNGAFTLTIKEAVVSDEAMYKCSRQFVFSNEEYVSVQSQSVCAKGKLTSDYLIFECDRVYPLDSVMVICQDKTINGSTTSVVNGDRYDIIWNSTETVELKREQTCNISFNFASRYYRNYTLSNIPVEGTSTETTPTITATVSASAATTSTTTATITTTTATTTTTASRPTVPASSSFKASPSASAADNSSASAAASSTVATKISTTTFNTTMAAVESEKIAVIVIPSVVGSLLIVGIVIALYICLKKHRQNHRKKHHGSENRREKKIESSYHQGGRYRQKHPAYATHHNYYKSPHNDIHGSGRYWGHNYVQNSAYVEPKTYLTPAYGNRTTELDLYYGHHMTGSHNPLARQWHYHDRRSGGLMATQL